MNHDPRLTIITSSILWQGQVRVIARFRDGREEVEELVNLITDAGRNLIAQALRTGSFDAQIKYVALGDSTTAPAAGQTQLGNERFRKAVTKAQAGATGQTVTTLYVAPNEANSDVFTIQEIGWFAGAGATSSPNTGVMIARVLYMRAKQANLESLQIERTDSITAP